MGGFSPLPGTGGGVGGGRGYTFQDLYIALKLAGLLTPRGGAGDLAEVMWEKKAIDRGGGLVVRVIAADVVLVRADGAMTFVDVKIAAPGGGNWTLAKLISSGVLPKLWEQWLAGPREDVALCLASSSPAEALVEMRDVARRVRTAAELPRESSKRVATLIEQTRKGLAAELDALVPFLRHVGVERLSPLSDLRSDVVAALAPFGDHASDLATRLVDLVVESKERATLWHDHKSLVGALLAKGVASSTLRHVGALVGEWSELEKTRRLHIWTADDFTAGLAVTDDTPRVKPIDREPIDFRLVREHRLPNLQREFRILGDAFDRWLSAGHRKRDEALPLLWLLDRSADRRSRALMACLARAAGAGHIVGDAGSDLNAAVGAVESSLGARPSPVPPVVAVDVTAGQDPDAWRRLRETLQRAHRDPDFRREGLHTAVIVAGDDRQARMASKELGNFVEFASLDAGGRPQTRDTSEEGVGLLSDRVYNRGLPLTHKELFGRARELHQLRQAWASRDTRVLTIVAIGGAGKSALVNRWLRELHNADYEDAEKVLIWSFYSQGTRNNLVSADIFVTSALSWLGFEDAISLSPEERGRRLADAILPHRLLLVLDGLEPLQHPPDAAGVGGRLTDISITTLLETLAKNDWPGLCVITTRVPVTDLQRFEESDDGERSAVTQETLRPLDEEDAVALLQYLIQRRATEDDLRQAVREVKHHALAVTLLGNYVREVEQGDLTRRINFEGFISGRHGGHARRIMEEYTKWLTRENRLAEIAVLHLIGLFDRPAEPDALAALLSEPALREAPELDGVAGKVWDDAVAGLIDMGLLNREVAGPPGSLDAHPLVREHFREDLQDTAPTMWRTAHRRLYAYYAADTPRQPASVAGMQPLYAAVAHGCMAGLHQQVYDELLLPRIWRDSRQNYSTRRLGMTGADLVALSYYFPRGDWTQMRQIALSQPARTLILTNAGVRLRQLGQLGEARSTFNALVNEIDSASGESQDFQAASYGAAAYCELLVIDGRLDGAADNADNALASGLRAIDFAEHVADPYFSMHARSSVAEVHFMRRDLDHARIMFEEAMRIDRERRPRPPFLYSQSLFRYGYYLIETGRAAEILAAAEKKGSWGTNGEDSSLLSKAIRLLVLGAACRALIEAGDRSKGLIAMAADYVDRAYDAFRSAGYPDYTVRGLLERVHFLRTRHHRGPTTDDYRVALTDLREATDLVDRGYMKLLRADILLERSATHLAFWDELKAHEEEAARNAIPGLLRDARLLVDGLGYGRRAAMVAELRSQAARMGLRVADARA